MLSISNPISRSSVTWDNARVVGSVLIEKIANVARSCFTTIGLAIQAYPLFSGCIVSLVVCAVLITLVKCCWKRVLAEKKRQQLEEQNKRVANSQDAQDSLRRAEGIQTEFAQSEFAQAHYAQSTSGMLQQVIDYNGRMATHVQKNLTDCNSRSYG